tara:strand:+ start:12082 stop:12699 length:618 start_codon:yes stop_codon:yes gene_type:complete
MNNKSEQEKFWEGQFGKEYIERNSNNLLVDNNLSLFEKVFTYADNISSICELGCNIGLNLMALNSLNNKFNLAAYELNEEACEEAKKLNIATIINQSIVEKLSEEEKYDLTFTKGVLIHINPDLLQNVYENLIKLSKKYILLCEYYNPSPVMVKYRGHNNKLFKRDFAGEMIDKYSLKLINYGFIYHRDNKMPQDDLSWFLMEKN